MTVVLYIASLLGAVAVYLLLPKRSVNWRVPGVLLGAGAVGLAWLALGVPELLAEAPIGVAEPGPGGIGSAAWVYYYVFSAIAIVSAVRVICNARPVYAALWFVMTVLASAGLFLVLEAEFIAFAMVIIYGGAILVTYMFVIMLATQPQTDELIDDQPEYERVAREPAGAVVAGFLLLAVLLQVAFPPEPMVANAAASAAALGADDLTLATEVLANRPADAMADAGEPVEVANVEHVGVDLFRGHPLGLELAGVILLVALIGAVVIARTRVLDPVTVEAGQGGVRATTEGGEAGPESPEVTGAVSGGRMGV